MSEKNEFGQILDPNIASSMADMENGLRNTPLSKNEINNLIDKMEPGFDNAQKHEQLNSRVAVCHEKLAKAQEEAHTASQELRNGAHYGIDYAEKAYRAESDAFTELKSAMLDLQKYEQEVEDALTINNVRGQINNL